MRTGSVRNASPGQFSNAARDGPVHVVVGRIADRIPGENNFAIRSSRADADRRGRWPVIGVVCGSGFGSTAPARNEAEKKSTKNRSPQITRCAYHEIMPYVDKRIADTSVRLRHGKTTVRTLLRDKSHIWTSSPVRNARFARRRRRVLRPRGNGRSTEDLMFGALVGAFR